MRLFTGLNKIFFKEQRFAFLYFFGFLVFVFCGSFVHVSSADEEGDLEETIEMVNELNERPDNASAPEGQQQEAFEDNESGSKNAKEEKASYIIFDDKKLLEGYKSKYSGLSKEILLEMIKDYNLNSYKSTAAVMVLCEKFIPEIVSSEKRTVEKILLRRLARTDSPFLQVQIMHTLCSLDRYRYFKSMVPGIIQKLNHYNATVNEIAFDSMQRIISAGPSRAREARTVFNTLRKILFLSRRRLAPIKNPGPKLSRKLQLLRWSIKILGTDEIRRLPEEVLHLL